MPQPLREFSHRSPPNTNQKHTRHAPNFTLNLYENRTLARSASQPVHARQIVSQHKPSPNTNPKNRALARSARSRVCRWLIPNKNQKIKNAGGFAPSTPKSKSESACSRRSSSEKNYVSLWRPQCFNSPWLYIYTIRRKYFSSI